MILPIKDSGFLQQMLIMRPACYAEIKGSPAYPKLQGMLWLYPFQKGSFVIAEVFGLPMNMTDGVMCRRQFYGFHIHSGSTCTGNQQDAFANTDGHYNPNNCLHPQHAGDFPSLPGNDGYALLMFYTDQFHPEDVAGRTVVVHAMPDDFHTQPAGNSGEKVGCGEIREM